uniref:RNase H type-1 domain-containing protein n=1 Tax=Cannabis sativa TaxID=3483 RepID=A0A803PJZ9_CANSA
MMACFWWGGTEHSRKIHWKKWSSISLSKFHGGLGFRSMKAFNQAMLAKQAWRLLQAPSSLVATILKARYFPHTTFLDASKGRRPSLVWISISWGKELPMSGLRKSIGDGTTTSIYNDAWIPSYGKINYLKYLSDGSSKVSDLITSSHHWDAMRIETIFPTDISQAIKSIPLIPIPYPDTFYWPYTSHGHYIVNSSYHKAHNLNYKDDPTPSNTMINQNWFAKNIKSLMSFLPNATFRHITRWANEDAHRLAKKSKSQAQKLTYNLSSPPIIASPIATPTPRLGDHDEFHSSDHTLSKSSSSNGVPNAEIAIIPLSMVSSRTRSRVSTPKKPEVVELREVFKEKKVVSSYSKAKSLKGHPPSISSSNSEPEEEIEDVEQESEDESNSSEELVPKEKPSADDSRSESEVPEDDLVSAEPVVVPVAVPKNDKGKRLMVSPSPILLQKKKRPSGIEPTEVQFDCQKVFGFLTNDNDVELSNTMHMSQLTYHLAVLMMFALSNWLSYSNLVNVSNELAFFLYKVSTSAKINLADIILEQISSLQKGKKPRLNLIFPHLVYKILSYQNELILENESIEMSAVGPTFKVPEKPL